MLELVPSGQRPLRIRLLAVALAAAAALGCDSVGRYLSDTPEDRLVRAAVAAWTTRGAPFLDGASGADTVASVTATGARGWEVAVLPPSGGVPSVWSLEIVRVEVYPVFPGPGFAEWLEQRARALGMSEGLPPETALQIRGGGIRAVGDLEARYGPAGRTTRTTRERVAYLVPRPLSDATEWRVQPDAGPADALIEAVKLVADDLVHADPQVLSCMGAPPTGVARSVQLDCLAEVLGRRFGAS
jgi:hypothetical protein